MGRLLPQPGKRGDQIEQLLSAEIWPCQPGLLRAGKQRRTGGAQGNAGAVQGGLGVVVARADDVREVAVGDEVYAMARFPEGAAGGSRAYAEYVSVPVSDLARKPLTLSHQQAAAVPMSLLTAWQFMIDPGHEVANPLQPGPHRPVPLAGKRVLVNGAAGGVGHFAVQLAKWQGAEVIAVAAGRHEAFLRQLGADSVIDYTTTAVEETVRDLDLVIDAPGGPASGRFLRTLRPSALPGRKRRDSAE